MCARCLLEGCEYLAKKNNLKQAAAKLEAQIKASGSQDNLAMTKDKFISTTHAYGRYLEADKEAKWRIILSLG